MKKLYALLLGIRAFVGLMRDPGNRLNEVFVLSDRVSDPEILRRLADELRRDPVGAQALSQRRRLRPIDLQELHKLPVGTLGRVYADEMLTRGLSPASIPTLPSGDEIEFLRAHLYESHDIWHAVTGFNIDVAGEAGLQAFYAAQFKGPLPLVILAAVMLNTVFWRMDEYDSRAGEMARGYLMGRRAAKLFGICWDDMWTLPLETVRAQLKIQPTQLNEYVALTPSVA